MFDAETMQDLARFGEILGAAVTVGVFIHFALLRVVGRAAKRKRSLSLASAVRYTRRPLQILVPLVLLDLGTPSMTFSAEVVSGTRHALAVAIIGCIAWLIVASMGILNDLMLARYDISAKDNLQARKVYTQFRVIRAIAGAVIATVAIALMLMTFGTIRQLGAAVLASAGIAGIVIGLAAQSTLTNLFAGLQIAFSEPIRLDDVVIVEGEWGRIEEITLTYVAVRIWDLRRLIVPISYFTSRPFQNWTRVSADLLGTVYFYVDYTVPVDEVRQELSRIVEASPRWDRKALGLQVTNISERTVELRALVSAADSSLAWDLRCEVREKLLSFLQGHYPDSLPRLRAELDRLHPIGDGLTATN